MYLDKSIGAILLGAGNSTRFGGDVKKQYSLIDGKTVLEHSIAGFSESEYVDEIVVVNSDNVFYSGVTTVHGGYCRLMSLKNGIEACDCDYIITHDGNRPLVDGMIIDGLVDDLMEAEKEYTIAVCYEKIYDSILKTDGTFANRDDYLHIQTPTLIKREDALTLFKHYYSDEWNNLWEMVAASGNPDKILFHKGNHKLMKITTREDLETIKKLI